MHSELEQHRRTKREAFVRKLTKATDRLDRRDVDSRLLSAAIAGAARRPLLEWVLASATAAGRKLVPRSITAVDQIAAHRDLKGQRLR